MRRVLADSNVIVSALLFPGSIPAQALARMLSDDRLVLTDWIIDELHEVVGRKWPDRLPALDAFLEAIPFELVAPGGVSPTTMRDLNDQPILDAAVAASVDIIVTGDRDFLALAIEQPHIITSHQYLNIDTPRDNV